ncbi:diacylglycerol kinase, partial [Citrobacter sp. TBCS-11]
AAGGGLTELTYSVPSHLKTAFGYLAYLAKGAELLPRVRKAPVRVVHDEGVFEGDISMFFAALTNSVGGFEKIAPD